MIRKFLALTIVLTSKIVLCQTSGCTDPLATNYNSLNTINDGSCIYATASVTPVSSWVLPPAMIETSGLIMWDHKIWTHNDDKDISIYAVDPGNVNNYQGYPLSATINNDWEEISQDSDYVYVGDFGNNTNGNRTDLKILRIDKKSILLNNMIIDTIQFSYSLQTNFNPTGSNNTDFDCEAFIVSKDSIYLFTKQWLSQKSSIYVLPKKKGTYIANYRATYDVQGLITGATYIESKKIIVLSGYNKTVQPFLYLLYDFNDFHFFNGNKRKISLNLPFHQVEGITTDDGLTYYISNENFAHPPITVSQKLHEIDMTYYLGLYLNNQSVNVNELKKSNIVLSPNPVNDVMSVSITPDCLGQMYSITDLSGRVLLKGVLNKQVTEINLEKLSKGCYSFILNNQNDRVKKIVKN